jgi:hemerythrin-like domain-containing protein
MKPRGPLMIEHRLIEKMIDIIKEKISEIKMTNTVDPAFIDAAVDFIKTYADMTHHGKEEDILFRECTQKSMSYRDTEVMKDLIDEHIYGRMIVRELQEAKENYLKDRDTLAIIIDKLNALVEFYPKHIEKEDDVFFPNSEKYFSEAEQKKILEEFWEFDKTLIHEKYKQVVEKLKNDDSDS